MPVQGFASITVDKETYKRLEKRAKKNHRSLSKEIAFLIEEVQEVKA